MYSLYVGLRDCSSIDAGVLSLGTSCLLASAGPVLGGAAHRLEEVGVGEVAYPWFRFPADRSIPTDASYRDTETATRESASTRTVRKKNGITPSVSSAITSQLLSIYPPATMNCESFSEKELGILLV
jgi:hypothetical protein